MLDECGVCGGVGLPGGICDCDGNLLDECGVCGGDGIPEGACDCDGTYPESGYDCDGNCLADADGDGVCDEFEVAGCQDLTACNYNADATDGDGSCFYAEEAYDCDGNCLEDVNNDGLCDIEGCTILEACNYDPTANLLMVDECIFPIAEGYACYEVIEGCTDIAAVNYNPFASVDDGSCITAVAGCMLPFACTFDPAATIMDFSMCTFAPCGETGETPTPQGMLVPGCMQPSACNYNPDATEDDGSCDYSCLIGCNNALACNYDPQVLYPDGSCEFTSCAGCMVADACNYDAGATIPDAGACDFVSCLGCPAPAACNYNPAASLNNFFVCEYCEFDFENADDYAVECEGDLPVACGGDVAVTSTCSTEGLDVACLLAENITGETVAYTATTAMGDGPDGAFRLYGASVQGVADSDFFLEDPANPLQLVRYDNGVAIMTGSVISDVNPDQRFDVFVTFEEGQDANAWLDEDPNHGFLVAFGCEPSIEEVFTLKGDQSYLVGQGEYEGDLITLSHMPVSENKRFQLGEGGNSHNCNFGFGGWFAWNGTLLNTPAGGMSGDIIVDLAPDASFAAATCGTESVSVFYTAMETGCDYAETHVQTISRVDTGAPEFISTPADVTAECDAVPAVADLAALLESGELLAMDACEAGDDPLTYAYEGEVITPTNCDGDYTIERTWSAVDCSGNASTTTQVITIEDTTEPEFVEALPGDLTVECDAVPAPETLTATDNCDAAVEVMFAQASTAGACPQSYTITRTWTVEDCSGNVNDHVQTIEVQDTTAPVFTDVPSDQNNQCEEASYTSAASDNCGAVAITESREVISDDACGNYEHLVTLTATDECGNSIDYQFTIVVQDTEAPVFVEALPSDETVECDAIPNPVTLTATDNCDSDVNVMFVEAITNGACPQSYTITRTWTVEDCSGNMSEHVQTIEVEDTTAPVFVEALPGNETVECDAIPDAAVLTATDNCDGAIEVVLTEEITNGSCPETYTLTRTWTVEDCSGNGIMHEQIIEVIDTTAPVFAPHDEFTMAACHMITDPEDPTLLPLVASDNCGSVTYEVTAVLFSGGCPGTWMRNWTATDGCGNVAYALQFVTMYDEIAPEFVSFPANVVIESDANCNADTSPEATGTPVISDNCGDNVEVTLDYVDSAVIESCPGSYSFTRTWIATDFCSNQSSQDQTIEVVDATGPVFTLAPSDQNNQCAEEPYAYAAEDNCTGTVIIYETRDTLSSDDCGNYVHLVTLDAHDICGNITTHEFTITVQDTQAPNLGSIDSTRCNSGMRCGSSSCSDHSYGQLRCVVQC